jgi:hypothetical protein
LLLSFVISIVFCYIYAAEKNGWKGFKVISIIFIIGAISIGCAKFLFAKGSGWALFFAEITVLAFFVPMIISQLLIYIAPILTIYFIFQKLDT